MLRWLVLLLAVAGLLVGLYVALGAEPALPAGLDRSRAPADVEPAPTPTAALTGGSNDNRRTGDATPVNEGRQPAVDESYGPLPVLVLRADGSAVSGARVTFLDRNRTEGWEENWDDDRQRDAFIRRYGKTEVSDDRGRLMIRGTGSGVLVAEASGLTGMLEWTGPVETPLKLVLSPEISLQVKVVDHRQRPQPGVRVSIVREIGGEGMSVLTRQTNGAEAIASFARVGRVLGGRPSAGAQHYVTLGFPCEDPPRIALDPRALPPEVLVLELPPVGSFEITVVDDQGLPLKDVANASMGVMTRAAGGERVFRAEHNERLIGGKALFPYVGVGAEIAIKLSGSRDRPDLLEQFTGPTRQGEVKRVTLRWVDLYPVLRGVAVSETGEVLKARRGRYMVWSGVGGSGGPPLLTGQDGRFRVVVSSPLEAVPGRRAELELYSRDGNQPLEALIDLSGPLTAGESELGHVIFRPKPKLVTGFVRDATGAGIIGAHVRVLVNAEPATGRSVASYSATTVKDGSFDIHGRVEGAFELIAVRRGFRTVRMEDVVPGTTGIDLVMLPDLPTAGDGR